MDDRRVTAEKGAYKKETSIEKMGGGGKIKKYKKLVWQKGEKWRTATPRLRDPCIL